MHTYILYIIYRIYMLYIIIIICHIYYIYDTYITHTHAHMHTQFCFLYSLTAADLVPFSSAYFDFLYSLSC